MMFSNFMVCNTAHLRYHFDLVLLAKIWYYRACLVDWLKFEVAVEWK